MSLGRFTCGGQHTETGRVNRGVHMQGGSPVSCSQQVLDSVGEGEDRLWQLVLMPRAHRAVALCPLRLWGVHHVHERH